MLISTLAIVLQSAPTATPLAFASDVATIVIALAIILLAGLASTVFLRMNRVLTEIRRAVQQNLGPVSDRARSISDNLEFITQALRTDVEKLHASVQSLTDRLQHASDRMEERIEEFNALMEVVQDEAEDIFLDTASTVRGVREGARTITGSSERRDDRRGGQRDAADLPGPAGVDRNVMPVKGDRETSAAPGRNVPPTGED